MTTSQPQAFSGSFDHSAEVLAFVAMGTAMHLQGGV